MQMKKWAVPRFLKSFIFFIIFAILTTAVIPLAHADININILAVNGTDKTKEKEINYQLPRELSRDDILSADGLKIEYDVNAKSYFARGTVSLAPKGSKTFKVRIRDVWQIDPKEIEDIKLQMDRAVENVKDVKGKDYTETATVLKKRLLDRINFIVGEQQRFEGNVERRIETFRIYSNELKTIRRKALSISYWRSDPAEATQNVVKFFVDVKNTSSENKTVKTKHYLPKEVKPEHFVNLEGFEIRHDENKDTLYLEKEEVLAPGQEKRYEFSLTDVWKIPQVDIDGLKSRTKDAFQGLQRTKYLEEGKYLVKSIEEKLRTIEETQLLDLNIYEHISLFRKNTERYESAKKDVESLEALLIAAKEEMEKSKLKNVLQKIKSLKTIAVIAESIFKTPKMTVVLKVIIGIIVFVGFMTLLWFFHWMRRSKADKINDKEEKD